MPRFYSVVPKYLLRLRNQAAQPTGEGANRVDPRTLNDLDRHVLKEAFRQARKLQGILSLEYQLLRELAVVAPSTAARNGRHVLER